MKKALVVVGLLAVQHVASQSLPLCAQTCVSRTKTKCKSTDYICACSDEKYLPRLRGCIDKTCDDGSKPQAHGFLSSLCTAVGHPIENIIAPAGAVVELRNLVPSEQASLAYRQIDATGFPESGFESSTIASATGVATTTRPSRGTATRSSGGSASSDNNNSGGGLSTGAKIGIGVGVPLGVGFIAGLVTLGFFLGRRSRRQNPSTTQTGGAPPAPGMVQYPYVPGPMAPAELSQSAQYAGYEMPTNSNTAEMAAKSPQPGFAQPVYAWPQPGQQPYPQYAQPGHEHFPSPGQQWPAQAQEHPTELPGRVRSP